MEPTSTGAVRVVGVAVMRSGSAGRVVLAAQRAAAAGGGWELPGGKCLPGETLDDAAVREIEEELGCTVRVTGRLPGVQPIRSGLSLEVVLAELVAGEPVALEHEGLRWLGPAELADVGWLPADVPFVAQLSAVLEAG